jgi:hypothetical protein
MLSRRNLAFSAIAILSSCSPQTPAVSFQQMKAYAVALIDALSVAADAYVSSPGAKNVSLVLQIKNDLQQLKSALINVEQPTDVRSTVLQIIQFAQELTPIVLPYLGPAAQYVPIALAVLQAFVASLPPPPNAPEVPPAPLQKKASEYPPQV